MTNEQISTIREIFLTRFREISPSNPSFSDLQRNFEKIFQILYANVQIKDDLTRKQNQITDRIQSLISTCSQYIYERHKDENEFIVLKDKLCRTFGEIGVTQSMLEHYRQVIRCLEQQTERLQHLLSHPTLTERTDEKKRPISENQRIRFDLVMRENNQFRIRIDKQKLAIETAEKKIEEDFMNLQRIQSIVNEFQQEKMKLIEQDSKLMRKRSNLQYFHQKIHMIEIEYQQRLKKTKDQYELVQKKHNELTIRKDQLTEKLTAMQQTNTKIRNETIEVARKFQIEQERKTKIAQQIRTLQSESRQLELSKHQTQQMISTEKHSNNRLEQKYRSTVQDQNRLTTQVQHLNEELNELIDEIGSKSKRLAVGQRSIEDDEHRLKNMKMALNNLIESNNDLETILREIHSSRIECEEQLSSAKTICLQKQKQFISYRKDFDRLSLAEHRLADELLRNSAEIMRLNQWSSQSKHFVQSCEKRLKDRKSDLLRQEKHRTYLVGTLRDYDDQIRLLIKRNQLIENELRKRIEHLNSLEKKSIEQQNQQTAYVNQKRILLARHQKQSLQNEQQKQMNERSKTNSLRQIKIMLEKYDEYQQWKINIQQIQQKIVQLIARNQRRQHEYALIQEKLRLHQQINRTHVEKNRRYSNEIALVIHRVRNLQQTHHQLTVRQTFIRDRISLITHSLHNQIIEDRNRLNFSDRPKLIRPQKTSKRIENHSNLVKRLVRIIEQTIQCRTDIAEINRLYMIRINEIYQQRKISTGFKSMIVRMNHQTELKRCKAVVAERRMLIFASMKHSLV